MRGDAELNVAYFLVRCGHPLSYALNLDPYERLLIAGMIDAHAELGEMG